MGRQNFERLGLLKLFTPELFEEPGRVLYVGAYDRRFFASLPLYQAGNEITVLEIWPPFIDGLKASRFAGRCKHIVEGDVTALDRATLPETEYEYALWFHGPEHVTPEGVVAALRGLEALATRLVVATCPWGRFPHGVAFDNPHTEHKSHNYPEQFQKLGYRVACIGPVDRPGSQLQAWKQIRSG